MEKSDNENENENKEYYLCFNKTEFYLSIALIAILLIFVIVFGLLGLLRGEKLIAAENIAKIEWQKNNFDVWPGITYTRSPRSVVDTNRP
jgi:hypothetical protein